MGTKIVEKKQTNKGTKITDENLKGDHNYNLAYLFYTKCNDIDGKVRFPLLFVFTDSLYSFFD